MHSFAVTVAILAIQSFLSDGRLLGESRSASAIDQSPLYNLSLVHGPASSLADRLVITIIIDYLIIRKGGGIIIVSHKEKREAGYCITFLWPMGSTTLI